MAAEKQPTGSASKRKPKQSKPKKGHVKKQQEKIGRNIGRTTRYLKEYDNFARRHCLLGATNEELAKLFNVNVATVERWIGRHESFRGSVNEGREEADARVVDALYHRALGYSHPEEKIFNDGGEPLIVPTTKHYPPDATSIIFWLKNRQREKWRDTVDKRHSVDEALASILNNVKPSTGLPNDRDG